MNGDNLLKLEKSLYEAAISVNKSVSCDTAHCYQLRRALLNSRFYHKNIFIRMYFRIVHKNKKVFLITSTVCASMFVVVFFNSYVDFQKLYKNLLFQTNHIERVLSDQVPAQKLQDLYRYGYLEYSHENFNGERVYKTNKDIKLLEVIDKEPYRIDLVLAD